MQRPILRSDSDDIDDWVIDSASFEMTAVKERTLSRYAFEQLLVSEDNTKLLLLVNAADDNAYFGGLGKLISERQGMEVATISGRQYYRLKGTITQGTHHLLVNGVDAKMYSQAEFEKDYEKNPCRQKFSR